MATQQHRGEEVEKALVLWDISNCPIPHGHDPLMVVHRIQTALGLVRPYGEISITAIGNNLTEIPGGEDVMRKLSSIGITLKHAHNYQMDLRQWARKNPPPATMMEWDRHASKYSVDRTNPANLPFGRSQELDVLLRQEMLRCQEMLCIKSWGGGFRPKYRSNSQSKH